MKISLGFIVLLLSTTVGAVEWLEVEDPESLEIKQVVDNSFMEFDDKTLRFNYTIRRNNPSDRKPGAILVRIEKHYANGEPIWREGTRNTLYWRNQFPMPARNFGEDTRLTLRSTFERFHTFGTGSIELRNDFHASIPPSWQTDEPAPKLQSFRFNDPSDSRSIQSATLLYYSGIGPDGSKIDFYVTAQDAFDKITITVVELNPLAGTTYSPKTVSIKNSKQ